MPYKVEFKKLFIIEAQLTLVMTIIKYVTIINLVEAPVLSSWFSHRKFYNQFVSRNDHQNRQGVGTRLHNRIRFGGQKTCFLFSHLVGFKKKGLQ